MTTEQLLAAAPRSGITAHDLDQLRDFLLLCDAARYAGEPADAATLRAGLATMAALAAHVESAAPAKGGPA
jgi:hypothetical protein